MIEISFIFSFIPIFFLMPKYSYKGSLPENFPFLQCNYMVMKLKVQKKKKEEINYSQTAKPKAKYEYLE